MKKIIGILGVVAFTMAMFFNVNTSNALKGDFDIASLLNISSANAECDVLTCVNYCYLGDYCWIWCNGKQLDCYSLSNTP